MSNARFSITPSRAVRDPELSDSLFRTLAALGIYGDENGWCWPGLRRLASDLNKSKPAVSKDVKQLREKGYLNVISRIDDKGQHSNKYQVRFDFPPPLTPEVNPPLTPEVNPPLTPEVNLNDPLNDPYNAPLIVDEVIPSPHEKPKPAKSKKVDKPRDVRLDHPSIKMYRDLAKLAPPELWRDEIIETIYDLGKWEATIRNWIGKGWNKANVSGMLDVYRNGIKDKSNGFSKQTTQERNIAALQQLMQEENLL